MSIIEHNVLKNGTCIYTVPKMVHKVLIIVQSVPKMAHIVLMMVHIYSTYNICQFLVSVSRPQRSKWWFEPLGVEFYKKALSTKGEGRL